MDRFQIKYSNIYGNKVSWQGWGPAPALDLETLVNTLTIGKEN